ncbi:MAG TPA: hypothetical protein DCY80_20270, partial [Solibacterales bacterium]|nr:hypothetical protein [Bryobacterales bacterium]
VLRAGEADQFEGVLAAEGEAEAARLRGQLKTLLVSMGEAEGEAEAARLRGQLKTLLVSMGEAFRVAVWGRNLKKGQ